MPRVFSARAVDLIKEHLNQHHGTSGLYMMNMDAALENLQTEITDRYPDDQIYTTIQLRRKLLKLAENKSGGGRVNLESMLRHGTCIIPPKRYASMYHVIWTRQF